MRVCRVGVVLRFDVDVENVDFVGGKEALMCCVVVVVGWWLLLFAH